MSKILILSFFISLVASGQSYDTIHSTINNVKTDRHVNIPGTRLYIIPPPGFIVSKNYLGLQKGNNVIIIYDIVGGNFYSNAATFDRKGFEEKGLRVFNYKQIKVNGYPSKYLFMQGDITASAHSLAFGDSTFCTMIMASYISTDDKTGNDIVKALNSIYYDKNRRINPFETAYFALDDKGSRYKFFHYAANLYTYTIGGTDNSKGTGGQFPVVLVTQLPKPENSDARTLAKLMIAKAVEHGLTNPKIKTSSTEKVNGYDAYEAEVYAEMNGKKRLIYQLIVLNGDQAVTIQGVANDNFDSNISEFKKLAHTVKFK
jgi:hypothetical protein